MIDGVTSTQGFNRYSYVHNNPLNATDPTGHFSLKDFIKIAVVVVLAVVTYGAASSWAVGLYGSSCVTMCSLAAANMIGGIVGGAAAGFVSGVSMAAMSGASGSQILRAGVQGAFSGAIFGGIGGSALGPTARIGAHAMAGGVLNVLQGGKFGHGFFSAGFTKFASINWISNIPGKGWSSILGRTMVASVVGGTVSKATGGKFANGANTAAFAHLFNQESRNIKENTVREGKSLWKKMTSWHFEGRAERNGPHPSRDQVRAPDSGWTLLSEDQSVFHDNGSGFAEEKYIHHDGREAVFTRDLSTDGTWQPYTDPKYMPTYNYVNPAPKPKNWYNVFGWGKWASKGAWHVAVDVLPFCAGGNIRGSTGDAGC